MAWDELEAASEDEYGSTIALLKLSVDDNGVSEEAPFHDDALSIEDRSVSEDAFGLCTVDSLQDITRNVAMIVAKYRMNVFMGKPSSCIQYTRIRMHPIDPHQ